MDEKIWRGNGRDAYGSCFFIPLVPVFNLVVRRGNREFHVHVQTRRRVLSILFLRLGLLSTRRKKIFNLSLSLSLLSLKRIVPRETENSGTRHYPMTILSVFPIYIYPCPISWLAVRSPAYHQHRNVRFGSRPNVTT